MNSSMHLSNMQQLTPPYLNFVRGSEGKTPDPEAYAAET